MARLNYSASSNANPKHGETSWCKYSIMLVNRELYKKKRTMGKRSSNVLFKAKIIYHDHGHVSTLPDAVVRELKPIYERLSKTELLDKCRHELTQNACESLNSLIWQRCINYNFYWTGLFRLCHS